MTKVLRTLTLTAIILPLLAVLWAGAASAATPVQFTLFNFNLPRDSQVIGARFPIVYGKGGGDVAGFDLQLLAYSEINSIKGVSVPPLFFLGANRIRNEMTGISTGIFNWHQGYDTGLNLALTNITNDVRGVNFGLINVTNDIDGLNFGLVNVTNSYSMIDWGLVNVSDESSFQLSLFNYAEASKFQLSLINIAEDTNFQLSLVNVTQELNGLQVGIFNCAKNGILPCFLLFNVGLNSKKEAQ